MRFGAWGLGVLVWTGLSFGCVERRYVITSDPPGAMVLVNRQPLGATPVDGENVYNGKHHFTLVKEGFETLEVDQGIPPRWYEYFPLDFVSESLIPWRIEDVRRFHYLLRPIQPTRVEQDLLHQAEAQRQRGRGILQQQSSSPIP